MSLQIMKHCQAVQIMGNLLYYNQMYITVSLRVITEQRSLISLKVYFFQNLINFYLTFKNDLN